MQETTVQRGNDDQETREIFRGILWWMNKRGLTPEELAKGADYQLHRLKAGFRGELQPIRYALRRFALALDLTSGRGGRFYEDETTDNLSDEELIKLFTDVVRDDDQLGLWSD